MKQLKMTRATVAGLVLLASHAWATSNDETVSTASDQQSVAITIYSDNLALVKDARRVSLLSGANQLAWREVSAQMRPETAQLRNLTNPGGCRSRILILIC